MIRRRHQSPLIGSITAIIVDDNSPAARPPTLSRGRYRLSERFSIAAVNAMDRATFIDLFGGVFEHSPWVAEAAWDRRPFSDRAELERVMTGIVGQAGQERQMALILAHPDLADRQSRAADLTEYSKKEQAGAGLDDTTAEEAERQRQLNRTYREKFGFPFIMAVRKATKAQILTAMAERVGNPPDVEYRRALEEINRIAGFRIEGLIGDG
jgi:2-oxo-4-hydroxy-4-carboxy-5-ureidoimidazoline decarboxylase